MFGSDWENQFFFGNMGKQHQQNTYLTNIEQDETYCGITPRAIYKLFQMMETEYGTEQFNVFCSFLQIYNEKIYDLLKDQSEATPLAIHENKLTGIMVEGLTEFTVSNYEQCITLMRRGERNRFVRHTSYNAKSSRSHTIFKIIIESTVVDKNGNLRVPNVCEANDFA
jgi:hypothetical protein